MFGSLFGDLVKTQSQTEAAMVDATILGIIVAIAALFIAIVLCYLIPWASDRRCYITRRWVFGSWGFLASSIFWIVVKFNVNITNPGFASKFSERLSFVWFGMLALYYVVGLALACFVFRNGKFGSILGAKKD